MWKVRLPCCALVLVPLLAAPGLARAITVTLTTDDGDDAYVNRSECGTDTALTIEWDLDSSSGSSVDILGSNTSGCPATSSSSSDYGYETNSLVEGLDTSTTKYTSVYAADVLSASGVTVSSCDADTDYSMYVCVRLYDSSGDTVATGTATLKYQLEIPPAPTSVAAVAGENALHVSWVVGTKVSGTASATTKKYRVYAACTSDSVSAATCTDSSTHSSDKTGDTSLRLGGLENGATYDVWVVAYSVAGNESDASTSTTGTPVPVNDFYETYVADGGKDQGGCNSAGASGLASVLGLLALRPRRRRTHGRWPGIALAATAALLGCRSPEHGRRSAPPGPTPSLPGSSRLPRSSVAAVLASAGALQLTPEQFGALEQIDRERAARVSELREQRAPKTRKAAGAAGARAPGGEEGSAPAGPGAGGGPGSAGGPGGGAPGAPSGSSARSAEDEHRAALQRVDDEEDTRAYLRAEELLGPSQRAQARVVAEHYREERYEVLHQGGQPSRSVEP